jgi:hypothetical protein
MSCNKKSPHHVLLTTKMLWASSKESGCWMAGRSAEKTPAASRHWCERTRLWRRRPRRPRLSHIVGVSAAVGLAWGYGRRRLSTDFPLASLQASMPGSSLTEAFAVTGVGPGCSLHLSSEKSTLEMPGRVVWGVKGGWLGVAGRR